MFCAFELCFVYFFVVGLKAATKMNVNIVILWLFDDNRPNLNQRVTDDLIPGLFFPGVNIWLLYI